MKLRLIVLILEVILCTSLAVSSCKFGSKPKLKVGTNVDYPPFSYRQDAEYYGVDVDLAKALGEKTGYEIEVLNISFEQLIPSLLNREIDFIASAMSITDDRAKLVQFTVPYYQAGQAFLKREDNPVEISTLEALALYRIGSMNSTTGMQLVEEKLIDTGLMPRKNLYLYRTNAEAITALLDEKIDFAVLDDAPARFYATNKPIDIAYEHKTDEQYGLAFRKKSRHYDKFNRALQELIRSGELDKILAEYWLKR
ncbi:MAG TPA: transporter substrate-binding domain-containing protein [Candidatus Cloacimonadota bacterium]|nr:transporter substrate-binding domain-containing protein [Candidatus Cloacimonadota bacterium]